ncbi:hypothetical protein STRINF_00726 [Streptococcus infantarius subsp. infantarius ATCC BAA-102]|uniref:Uncharacterized protein n=1 Tax=Streptococcus infantarius subsp. infantarius ATCC BAA-102 TaxID=471872 RepID=A0ABM9XF51_9STRE|nr:hypothetical protein STRINF_00726 [Streptococcus infantarius subsp. infantarius ATCC BAA-102]
MVEQKLLGFSKELFFVQMLRLINKINQLPIGVILMKMRFYIA